MTQIPKPRVAIIGAGLTGLTAAYHLQKSGVAVTLYEKSQAVGGRTMSLRRDGFIFDLGAITMLPTYRHTCALIDELGIAGNLHRIYPVIGIPRGGQMHRIDVRHPVRSLLSTKLISLRAKLRLLKLLSPLRQAWSRAQYETLSPLAAWDGESIASYVRRELGDEVNEYIAGPVIRGNTLNSTESAPFGELLWMLRQYAAPYLYGFDQGINFLAETLGQRLPVEFGADVQKIEKQATQVVVSGVGKAGAFSERFDACVIALPPSGVRALTPDLSPGQQQFLDSIKPLPSINVHIGLRRRPQIAETFILPPESEQPILTTIVMDHLKAPGRAPEGKGAMSFFCRDTWYEQNAGRSDQDIVDDVLRMARPFIGDLSGDVETAVVQRWPYAIIKSEPGLYHRIAEYERDVDAGSRVQYGGDFLSMGMEAAVSSGVRMAQNVQRILGPAARPAA